MKVLFFCCCFLGFFQIINAQSSAGKVASSSLKKLTGEEVNSLEYIAKDSGLVVLSFWATWCKPCLQELETLNDLYPQWKQETGVRIVAISIDDARNTAKIPAFVSGKGWAFEVLLDANSEFKRKMNVVSVPHTFLVNAAGEIKYQHASYSAGDEEDLFEAINTKK